MMVATFIVQEMISECMNIIWIVIGDRAFSWLRLMILKNRPVLQKRKTSAKPKI